MIIVVFNMHPDFLAIDFETANYSIDSACAIGLVRVSKGKIVSQKVSLVKPKSRSFVFTHVHGITWTDVSAAPTFGELWPEIAHFFSGIEFLAAHNASFDRRVLTACCQLYGIPVPVAPFSCSVKLARQTWGIRPTNLANVCRHLDIPLNHHEALSDAMACAKIFLAAGRSTVIETQPGFQFS
ncbi:MAG: 3'-5' exonuclease [Bdellovibrionia bacterium]